MLGTIVNTAAVILGSLIGLLFGRFISEDIKKIIMQATGLCVFAIGVSMAIKTQSPLIFIGSMVLGAIIGQLLDIEGLIERFGNYLKKKTHSKDNKFIDGFMTAFFIACIGGMTIVGTIQDGTLGDPSILLTKSMLDGSTAIVLTSSMGIGVMFSAIPLLIFQGALTLCAGLLKNIFSMAAINEMSAVGGLLIMAIGLNLLDIKKLKLGNLLPSIFVVLLLSILFLK
jgi:uncharacterized membrane protein YqgA involved in biofilm formation